MKSSELVVGIILAGGLAKRMGGGDKCLLPLAGKTLLNRTIERAQPQVSQLLLNANGNSLRFARTRLPVIADKFPDNLGPLDGIHAGMSWMQANTPDKQWLVSFASDTPFFPCDMVEKLLAKATSTKLAVASSKLQTQPVFALWHISLFDAIQAQLESGVIPRLEEWVKKQEPAIVDFSVEAYDPFFNINTPQDLYTAESIAALVQ